MSQQKLGTFKIASDRWDAFVSKAAEQGTNASALLKQFVELYLDGRVDLSAESPQISVENAIASQLAPIREELAELRGKLQPWSKPAG